MPAVRKDAAKPAKPKVRKGEEEASSARLSVWTRAVIWGMHLANMPRADMRQYVKKKDDTPVGLHAIDDVIARKTHDTSWEGEDSSAGGRPRALSPMQEKLLLKLSSCSRSAVSPK